MNRTRRWLISEYRRRKSSIKERLAEFRKIIRDADDARLFEELCFCLMTANANALHCDTALKELKKRALIAGGSCRDIIPHLRGRVRFHNRKASYITGARRTLARGSSIGLRGKLDPRDIAATRDWLVENIKGLGYKEASHFLRNIGLGRDIAILDRHILKNLKKHGVIRAIPSSVGSRKTYLAIEEKMRRFSRRIRIPMDELDLLFWSIQTGFIFK